MVNNVVRGDEEIRHMSHYTLIEVDYTLEYEYEFQFIVYIYINTCVGGTWIVCNSYELVWTCVVNTNLMEMAKIHGNHIS